MTTPAKAPSTKSAARTRKPAQDHQPSQEQKQLEFSEIEGHELLKPITSLRAPDMMRLQGRLLKVLGDGTIENIESTESIGQTVKASDFNFDAMADLVEYVGDVYSIDPDAFWQWASGEGALNRTQTLVMGYVSAMGKGSQSTDS
ncbi:hypothetical protein [Kocuria sp.]|uniref:hypothetical protein n=1 Tax=Kocuria sp. TaxID=1871328 RepID=UPI0026E0E046|nr:hypothetical protein [Kocuria sp.]MDO5619270.1 hypothetical protein [Kocuria sp.]